MHPESCGSGDRDRQRGTGENMLISPSRGRYFLHVHVTDRFPASESCNTVPYRIDERQRPEEAHHCEILRRTNNLEWSVAGKVIVTVSSSVLGVFSRIVTGEAPGEAPIA